MTVRYAKSVPLLLFAAFAAFLWGGTRASAKEFDARSTLKAVQCLRALIETGSASGRLNKPDAKKKVNDAYGRLVDAFVTRAQKFHDKQHASRIRQDVFNWLKPQERALSSPRGIRVCTRIADKYAGFLLMYFDFPKFDIDVTNYSASDVEYDTVVPVEGQNENLRTYVLPGSQASVFDSIQLSLEEGSCEAITVESIQSIRRTAYIPGNTLIFTKPPITYDEVWRVTCGDVTKDVDVTLSRDSEGVKRIDVMPRAE